MGEEQEDLLPVVQQHDARRLALQGEGAHGSAPYRAEYPERVDRGGLGVITGDDVLPMLIDACPSFVARADVPEVADGDPLPAFAHHLVELATSGDASELPAVFTVVDAVLDEGDGFAVSIVRTGLIEELQNIASHRDVPVDPDDLRPVLGPRATEVWDELDAAWQAAADAELGDRRRSPAETYLHLGHVDRRKIQSMTRELPDGTLAAPSDVVRYEAARYDEELGRWLRVMRRAPLVAVGLVLVALVLLYAFR
ncbi:MAG: hypothetical protein U5R31_01450 [Acidimicrobiia bacterium]|nr:hypothetical protein [Acidimicrobiia bacterium]